MGRGGWGGGGGRAHVSRNRLGFDIESAEFMHCVIFEQALGALPSWHPSFIYRHTQEIVWAGVQDTCSSLVKKGRKRTGRGRTPAK